MTSTKAASTTTTSQDGAILTEGVILPYRSHLVDLATTSGWKYSQTSTMVDTFTKGDLVLGVSWSTRAMSEGMLVQGKGASAKLIDHKQKGTSAKLEWTWGILVQGKPFAAGKKFNLKAEQLAELKGKVAAGQFKVLVESTPAS